MLRVRHKNTMSYCSTKTLDKTIAAMLQQEKPVELIHNRKAKYMDDNGNIAFVTTRIYQYTDTNDLDMFLIYESTL